MQPFVAVGHYSNIRKLAAPSSYEFTPVTLDYNPDFNSKSLHSNVVLRWEYVKGSTLYAVWNLSGDDLSNPGVFRGLPDVGTAFGSAHDAQSRVHDQGNLLDQPLSFAALTFPQKPDPVWFSVCRYCNSYDGKARALGASPSHPRRDPDRPDPGRRGTGDRSGPGDASHPILHRHRRSAISRIPRPTGRSPADRRRQLRRPHQRRHGVSRHAGRDRPGQGPHRVRELHLPGRRRGRSIHLRVRGGGATRRSRPDRGRFRRLQRRWGRRTPSASRTRV